MPELKTVIITGQTFRPRPHARRTRRTDQQDAQEKGHAGPAGPGREAGRVERAATRNHAAARVPARGRARSQAPHQARGEAAADAIYRPPDARHRRRTDTRPTGTVAGTRARAHGAIARDRALAR